MKEHYFKQKIYDVDRLLNRQLYIAESTKAIRSRHQRIQESLKGGELSESSLMLLKNSEEKRRLIANKEFSAYYWEKLKKKHSLGY